MIYGPRQDDNENDRLRRLSTSVYGDTQPESFERTRMPGSITTDYAPETAERTAPPPPRTDPWTPPPAVTATGLPPQRTDPWTQPKEPQISDETNRPPAQAPDPFARPTTTATIGPQQQPSVPGSSIATAMDGSNPDWYGKMWNLTQNRPDLTATPDPNVQGLNQGSSDLAMAMLANPTRYDTDLFNTLFSTGLERLDQENEKARLRQLRDNTRRLGPQSGQLTNEFIDLEAEFGNRRTDLLNNLAREAAMTQMQDRLGALAGAQGVSGQLFGQGQSLRDEQRLDRASQLGEMDRFGQIDRQLGRDAMDDYFRQFGAETQANEALSRLMQSEFANNMALAQLFANMPGAVDPGDGSGVPTNQDPFVSGMDRKYGQAAAQARPLFESFMGGQLDPMSFAQQMQALGYSQSEIQEMIAQKEGNPFLNSGSSFLNRLGGQINPKIVNQYFPTGR